MLSLTGGWASHDEDEDLSGEEDSDDDDKEKVDYFYKTKSSVKLWFPSVLNSFAFV